MKQNHNIYIDQSFSGGNIIPSFEYVIENIKDRNARIIEIGCNQGDLTYKLFKFGYKNLTGCDINPNAIVEARKKYPEISDLLISCDGANLPFKNDTFDYAISFDVIEHIPNVDNHMQEIKRILVDNGQYIFQTPNKIINIPWEVIRHKSLNSWKIYHCSLHTLSELKARIISNNFVIVRLEKNNLFSDYNIQKVKKTLGVPGLMLLKVFSNFPLFLFPNFWCVIKNKKNKNG